MQKRSWIFLSLLAVSVTAVFLLAGTPTEPAPKKADNSCCKVKMQECLKKQKAATPGKMIMENLSSQFLVILPF